MASQIGLVDNSAQWAIRHRLTRIVDQIDPALSCMRGDAWMDRYLIVDGDPVPAGPCVFTGFHYGPGFWSLRYLRRKGHPVSVLARPTLDSDFPHEPLRARFERWRMEQAASAGGAQCIYVGGVSAKRMRSALGAGHSVLGLVDVPEPTAKGRMPVDFMGSIAWLPDGFLRVAASCRVPLIAYVASFDELTGRRRLSFYRLENDVRIAMQKLASLLEHAIRTDPAPWHLWANWPQFFDECASS